MLRAIIRLLRELAYEERPLPERLRIYDALGKLATRLGTLLKTERSLDKGQDLTGTLSQALAEVIHELSQEGDPQKAQGFPRSPRSTGGEDG